VRLAPCAHRPGAFSDEGSLDLTIDVTSMSLCKVGQ
jgi:hypothetical protein